MAFEKLTDYERKRLENIRLNDEKMASLKLQSIKAQVSASTKRPRVEIKSYKVSPKKQPKTQTPIVMRRSLRTRGLPPDANGLSDEALESMAKTMNSSSPSKGLPCYIGPLSMKDAYRGVSDRALIEAILDISKKPQLDASVKGEVKGENGRFEGGKVESSCFSIRKEVNEVKIGVKMEPLSKGIGGFTRGFVKKHGNEMWSSLKLESLTLKPENVARVVPGRIMNIFTSCYDGYIRLMDAEKEVFDLVHSSGDPICSMSQQSKGPNCLYFAEGNGGLSVWDQRTGSFSNQWSLHEYRIISIDFSSANPNLMATSSSDGTACIWDLRSIDADKTLRTVSHSRAVHSAYFSPSGGFLATTSIDDTVGISSGANFEYTSMIYHNNNTSRWISKFRGIWGWDDAYVFIGNVKRGVNVISPAARRTVLTLESPHMTAIPCRFDAHPYNVGMLAGSTAGGQVYVWTLG
ncbi:WD repeat-containing protein 76-like [Pyrus ussuriensis x Pyrus communis]|uniref:WD repeat-containing protein 76-like n=1 Tax=Pyrus ussuriensis x Pyrus communis TaxID=2448454 RepID=A0A5N5GY16_9ROSA|nr:WD repeat-containing protein 76-like [Pyrus ussuriensis x Pyrus communis]